MNSNEQKRKKLTQYPSASMMEVLTISLPIMISALSSLLMNFFDRVILAQYSTDAMNAGITAGMSANIFLLGFLGVSLIAEVFVGKKNGAGFYKEAARPAWQMIWFSVASILFFFPVAFFAYSYFVPIDKFDGMAIPYFKILMLFGPLFPLVGALTAFFIGIGKTKIVSIAAIVGNLVNIGADTILVFGFDNIISSSGIAGAAVGTGIAQIVQAAILLFVFFKPNYRQKYCTDNYVFDKKIFFECIKVGAPSSLGHMIEIAAWSIVLRLMANAGDIYITLLAFGQSMHVLFAFATEGLQKGVTSIAANMIGSASTINLNKLIKSAINLLLIIMLFLLVPLALYPDPIIKIFLLDEYGSQKEIYDLARLTGILVWIYLLADGLVWIFAGVLTAFSDTKFVMLINALSAWSFALIPIFIFITKLQYPPQLAWILIDFYAIMNALFFYLRCKSVKTNNLQQAL